MRLHVDVDGQYWSGGAIVPVPELQQRCFEPLKTCDDGLVALVLGESLKKEETAVIKTREDAAEILAKELTHIILNQMKKNDTHNGYPKKHHERIFNAASSQ